jgi:O-methyltransferase
MHWRQYVPNRVKWLARKLAQHFVDPHLEKLATKLEPRFIDPKKFKDGWRPPLVIDPTQIQAANFGYDEEPAIKQAMTLIWDHTMLSFDRLATLWLQVRYLDRNQIPGALVECGTWRGGAVGMMGLAHLASSRQPVRRLHLFDSFEGLPQPQADKDGDYAVEFVGGNASGALVTTGLLACSVDVPKKLLSERLRYPETLVLYHIGWFQETLPRDAASIAKIALLRLDGDWYESTRVCLEYLYPKVVKNGVIVIDDYGYWSGCRRAVDEFISSQPNPILLHHIDSMGRYWVKS